MIKIGKPSTYFSVVAPLLVHLSAALWEMNPKRNFKKRKNSKNMHDYIIHECHILSGLSSVEAMVFKWCSNVCRWLWLSNVCGWSVSVLQQISFLTLLAVVTHAGKVHKNIVQYEHVDDLPQLLLEVAHDHWFFHSSECLTNLNIQDDYFGFFQLWFPRKGGCHKPFPFKDRKDHSFSFKGESIYYFRGGM